jgi:hypothetical protein
MYAMLLAPLPESVAVRNTMRTAEVEEEPTPEPVAVRTTEPLKKAWVALNGEAK